MGWDLSLRAPPKRAMQNECRWLRDKPKIMVKSEPSNNERRKEVLKDNVDDNIIRTRGRESLRRTKGKGTLESSRREVWEHGGHSKMLINDERGVIDDNEESLLGLFDGKKEEG